MTEYRNGIIMGRKGNFLIQNFEIKTRKNLKKFETQRRIRQ